MSKSFVAQTEKRSSGQFSVTAGLLTLVPVGIPTTPNTRILRECGPMFSDTREECLSVQLLRETLKRYKNWCWRLMWVTKKIGSYPVLTEPASGHDGTFGVSQQFQRYNGSWQKDLELNSFNIVDAHLHFGSNSTLCFVVSFRYFVYEIQTNTYHK